MKSLSIFKVVVFYISATTGSEARMHSTSNPPSEIGNLCQ